MNIQEHLLVKMSEECAEISQRACKALRFGLLEVHNGLNNARRIEEEFSDLMAVHALMVSHKMIKPYDPGTKEQRCERIAKYLNHSKTCGTLE